VANITRFAIAMERRGEEVERGTIFAMQKGALAIGTALVMSTPVLTGNARGNWQMSLGLPADKEIGRLDPSGATTIAAMTGVVSQMRPGGGLSSRVFITNNVPYIAKLNAGSSPQAAAGWVERAVIAGSAAVEGVGGQLFRRRF